MARTPESRDAFPPSEAFDASESLRILDESAARVRERLQPDDRQLYAAWGLSWTLGYVLLWLSADPFTAPPTWAFLVFAALLVGAGVFSGVHLTQRTTGIRGPSAVSGAIYGWSWVVSFLAVFVISSHVARADLDPVIISHVSFALPVLVVGILYMTGAAIFRSIPQFLLGAWIILVLLVALFFDLPTAYAVMGLAGGGGMFAVALGLHLYRSRPTAKTA
ncbi:hypothetical protein [Nesterenkonia sp. CF4.4]|uniref:hypothetical protein n=1 Tax=Nesterenkonia sp. CF4.4 TaxID=3373079 RepID=UPI003EE4398C